MNQWRARKKKQEKTKAENTVFNLLKTRPPAQSKVEITLVESLREEILIVI